MPHSILRCSDFPIPFCLEECQSIITGFVVGGFFFFFSSLLVLWADRTIPPGTSTSSSARDWILSYAYFSSSSVCLCFIDAGAQALPTSAVSIAAPSTAASWSSGSPAYSSGGTGPVSSWLQVLGLVLLTLVEFPEVFFLSLADDGENTSDGFANSWDLGEFGSQAT